MLAPPQISSLQSGLEVHGCKTALERPLNVAAPMHSGVTELKKGMRLIADELSSGENGVRECFPTKNTFRCVRAVGILQYQCHLPFAEHRGISSMVQVPAALNECALGL